METPQQLPRRRRRSQEVVEEMLGELNLVPYLDVMVNLIMFLLLTSTVLNFGLIAFNVPTYSKAGAPKPPEEEEKPLELTVWVSDRGFEVVSNKGAPLPPIGLVGPKEDAGYDFNALRRLLVSISEKYPRAKKATLKAAPNTPYWIVVKTLDMMREAKPGECKIARRKPNSKELAEPFDPGAPPVCDISDDGSQMKCRTKEKEVVTYTNCLFPDVILSEKVK